MPLVWRSVEDGTIWRHWAAKRIQVVHEWLEAPEENLATTSLTEHRSEMSGRHAVQGRGCAIRAAMLINSP